MPVDVEDSRAHLVQHLRGIMDCAKVRGQCHSYRLQLPRLSTTLAMNTAGFMSFDRHGMSCDRRTRHVRVAASKFRNIQYGMDGVLCLSVTLRELQPQVRVYTTNGMSLSVAESVKVL
jgi:hypothetical protein